MQLHATNDCMLQYGTACDRLAACNKQHVTSDAGAIVLLSEVLKLMHG
jgi:hypothetical protein